MELTSDYGIISIIPICVLMIGVIITKKMPEMLLLSTFIGSIILYKTGFLSGYIGMLYQALSNGSYQFLFFILLGFGPLMALFDKSGSLLGFSGIISKFAKTQKRALLATWILGIIVFIDDYLNALAVSVSMKNITDELGIPREHLAYTVNSTGSCICVLVPIASWAAFGVGNMQAYELGFSDYLSAIPFMFYAWAAVIISLLLGIGLFPKIGPIKKAYQRVADGGTTTIPADKSGAKPVVSLESSLDTKPSSPLNLIVPLLVVAVAMIYFDNDLIHGLIAGLVCQAIMYLGQRIMKPVEFMNTFLEGIGSMANLIFVILIAFVLSGMNEMMGFPEFVIGVFTKTTHPAFLPAITFFVCALTTFLAASFWAMIVITMPIFIPLALSMGVAPHIVVAAIMSGTALGSQACLYSDAVFMTSAGTEVPNVPQVRAALPYVGIGVVFSLILYLAVGLIMYW